MGAAWVQSVLYPLALEGGNSNYNTLIFIANKQRPAVWLSVIVNVNPAS